MDVTTFDTRITRESTESIRSSLAANNGAGEGGAFVEHLLQEPIARRAESPENSPPPTAADDRSLPESSASPDENTTEVADQTDTEMAVTQDPEASGQDDEETSHDVDQDEVAAVAAALASQTTVTATTDNRAATAAPPIATEPQPAGTAVTPPATDPPSGTDEPLGVSVVHTEPTSEATSAPTSLADNADGVPTNVTNATSGAGQAAAMASAAGGTVAAAPNAVSDALATETTEKSTSSTKTRNEKANAKGRTTSGKNGAGDATADTGSNSATHTQDATEASQANPTVALPGPDVAVDRSAQNPATVTMGNEANASGETNTRSQSLTERLPEQIFGRSSSAAGNSDELSSVDQMRLVQRVARAIEAAPQNGGILRLRLRPPELGAIRLEVAIQRGKMTARIETETTQARNVLLDQLPQLRERLEEQGIRIERFDVEVGPQDQGDSSSQSSHTEESYRSSTSRENRPQTIEAETMAAASADSRLSISATRVNVII